MQRTLLNSLLDWKSQANRKPVFLDGARQTGKTFLLSELFSQHFPRALRIDFLESPRLMQAFDDSLEPKRILANLELLTNKTFSPDSDLLILDEIGECPRAITALKYFAEQMPHAWIAATGSNIGLLGNFPVGKVEQLQLRPLSFHEFLKAGENQLLVNAYESKERNTVSHGLLFDQLTDYYFTGGMPEAVAQWFKANRQGLLERTQTVNRIHRNLVEGYLRDFGKYAGKLDAQLLSAVFTNIPSQLSQSEDDSIKRFRFKDVHHKKSRYTDFENAIAWLHRARLILKNHPIEGMPRSPLAAYRKDNLVKLFLFDTGLLNHMLGSSYLQIKNQAFEYKGYIAESFVQQELAVLGHEPSFSWQDARAEIEFLLTDASGEIFPVEVKSGKRTKAKSLQSYIQKCSPTKTVKLTGTQGSSAAEKTHIVMPLYDVQYVLD